MFAAQASTPWHFPEIAGESGLSPHFQLENVCREELQGCGVRNGGRVMREELSEGRPDLLPGARKCKKTSDLGKTENEGIADFFKAEENWTVATKEGLRKWIEVLDRVVRVRSNATDISFSPQRSGRRCMGANL